MFVAVLSDYGGLFCFLKIDQLFFWNTCERGNWCSFPEQQLSFQSHFSLFLINKNCLGVLALKDYILQVQQQWPHRYFVSCPSKRGLISGAVLKMLCSWLNLTISFSLSEENTSSAGWADSRRWGTVYDQILFLGSWDRFILEILQKHPLAVPFSCSPKPVAQLISCGIRCLPVPV